MGININNWDGTERRKNNCHVANGNLEIDIELIKNELADMNDSEFRMLKDYPIKIGHIMLSVWLSALVVIISLMVFVWIVL